LHNCFTVLENTDTASHRVCEAEDNVDWEEDDSIYVEPKCRGYMYVDIEQRRSKYIDRFQYGACGY
jgi:hypothetical protein